MNAAEKLDALRAALRKAGVHAFILPVADEYLSEYVPASAQRLAWLTDFTGSAGLVAVLTESAALFVDGRYTLQSRQEADAGLYMIFNSGDIRPEAWLAERMEKGQVLGFDPWLHSARARERLEKALTLKGITLKALSPNPVDALWKDRPAAPSAPAFVHEPDYAGEEHAAKRARVCEAIRKAGAEVAVLAAADSVDWLFNIRGQDMPYSPLFCAYALVEAEGHAAIYTDAARIPPEVEAHLAPGVEVREPARLAKDIKALKGRRVLADAALLPEWFFSALKSAKAEIVTGDDPCQLPKAIKNEVELEGMRRAHRRDGLALTRFLSWLDGRPGIRESEAAAKLLEFRALAPEFVSPSFETIAGSGPNGAIVHYRVTEKTDRELQAGELFLLDSGGQYPDGTTDVTRTIAIGASSPEQRERFTRVLKGHIALATALFPEGTAGGQLDVLARRPLWDAGLDYDHGTGHGVGCFLNVHEGPQRISKRMGDAALKPGMIVSNEPGYYREGAYGIRIENLVAVAQVGEMENGRAMLGFETLTCVPIDLRLINALLLTRQEKDWLNAYHAWVFKTHEEKLNPEERAWLLQATRMLD